MIIQADRQPRAQQNDNAEQNHRIDNGTQDDEEEIFTLEDIMNQLINKQYTLKQSKYCCSSFYTNIL